MVPVGFIMVLVLITFAIDWHRRQQDHDDHDDPNKPFD